MPKKPQEIIQQDLFLTSEEVATTKKDKPVPELTIPKKADSDQTEINWKHDDGLDDEDPDAQRAREWREHRSGKK